MSSEESAILEYAYTRTLTLMASFIKQMAITYGVSIRPTSLRYAVLAYGAFKFPSTKPDDLSEEYVRKAQHELLRRVGKPACLRDFDVFAAMILAWICIYKGRTETSIIHAGGCLTMLRLLLRDNNRRLTDILTIFSPLVVDNLTSIFNMAGQDFPIRTTPLNFTHRYLYYELLCQTGSPKDAWQPAEIEATYNTIRGAIGVVFQALGRVTLSESLSEKADHTPMIRYIIRKLDDDGFTRLLKTLESRIRTDETDEPESQLIRYLSLGHLSLNILLTIFKHQTILQGIDGHDTAFLGARLQASIHEAGRPRPELNHYRDMFYASAALCSIIVRPSRPYECMNHHLNIVTFSDMGCC